MHVPVLVNPMADKATPAINGAAKPAANPTPTPITALFILESASAPSPPAAEFVLFPILIGFFSFSEKDSREWSWLAFRHEEQLANDIDLQREDYR